MLDNIIRSLGHWPDCDMIPTVQQWLPACRAAAAGAPLQLLDVGANIGACTALAAARGWNVRRDQTSSGVVLTSACGGTRVLAMKA